MMRPPKAPAAGTCAAAADELPAVSSCLHDSSSLHKEIRTLTKRPDFLRAARARREVTRGFILQARRRGPEEGPPPEWIRVGYTCSKKVGNAVARNRAKRRLRAIAQDALPQGGRPGWDYVLIGRATSTANRPYLEMVSDLTYALAKIHGASNGPCK